MTLVPIHARTLRVAMLSCIALAAVVENSYAAQANDTPSAVTPLASRSTELSAEMRASLEPALRGLLQARLDMQSRLPGQAPIITVGQVSFDQSGDTLTVELGKGYVPTYYGGDFEDHIDDLSNVVTDYMARIGPIYNISFTFEGRDILDYFPFERGLSDKAEMSRHTGLFRPADAGKGRVLVSAGHGYYFHKKLGWTAQRTLTNGVLEDIATTAFASSLDAYLVSRSGAEVFRSRSLDLDRHPGSGQPWTAMASRYFLKDMLPSIPSIWNSKPGEGGDLEEYNQDIRSRPFYANHLGVNAAVHLHTNAGHPTARGIRVFHAPGREEDRRFASNALCYIKESLRSNQAYEDFPVSAEPEAKGHGENRYAEMPSIIAEVGFHSNKDDAAAIGSYVFRDLTMRGLEKGYRMFREGLDCEPFTVQHPEVNLVSDTSLKADLVFGGAPRFPVKYEMAVAECTPGIICAPRYGRFKDPAAPLVIDYGCTAVTDHPFTIKWNASFIDADGIKANAVVTMTCKPQSSRPA